MIPTRSTPAALAVLLVLLAGCGHGPKAGDSARLSGLKPREATRVLVTEITRHEMLRRLETTTRIESQNEVAIFPRAAGVVVELLVEEGDAVEQGQVLARLDDREQSLTKADARVALEEAQAELPKLEFATREAESRRDSMRRTHEQAAREHERNVSIASGEGGIELLSRRDLDASLLTRDQSEGDYQTANLAWERARLDEAAAATTISRAKLTLETADLTLSHMQIVSPITGVISERLVRVGDTVSSAAAAFEVTDPGNLRTVFQRPQRELALFQQPPGDGAASGTPGADLEVDVRAEALPGRLFRARIERISPTIDPASGNFRVTAEVDPLAVDDPGARLLPGMLVRLEIVTERHADALVVPKRAVRREGDRSVLFVVREGVARSVLVAEGFTDDRDVEVTPLAGGTLAEGEQVIVVGNRDLEDGAPVAIGGDDDEDEDEQRPAPEPAADGPDSDQ